MAVLVKHAKTSAVADIGDASLVQPSDWNSNHTVTGLGSMAEADADDFVPEAPTDGLSYSRRGSDATWQPIVSAPGLSTAEYTYATNIAAPPATGQLRANTTTQSAITSFYLHYTNAVGIDISNALRLIVTGDKILVQDKTTASNHHYYEAAGDAVDHGTYLTVPVVYVSGGANLTVGRVIFAVFGLGTGGGAPSGITEAPTDGALYYRRGSTTAWVAATVSTSAPSGGADGDIWYQVP